MSTNISPAGTKSSSSRFLTVLVVPLAFMFTIVETRDCSARAISVEEGVRHSARESSSWMRVPDCRWGWGFQLWSWEVEPKISPETVGFLAVFTSWQQFTWDCLFSFSLSFSSLTASSVDVVSAVKMCSRSSLNIGSDPARLAGWSFLAIRSTRRVPKLSWLMPAGVVAVRGKGTCS